MERPRPFARDGLVRRAGPYGAAVLLAFALVPMSGTAESFDLAVAAVVMAATVAAVIGLPWERLPRWTEVLPALGLIVVVAFLREAEGGAVSGFGPLMTVAIVWLAIYGNRAQLIAGLWAGTAAFVVPILLIGDPAYPMSEWRRAALWYASSLLVGFALQALLQRLRAREEESAARAEEMRIVLESMSDGLVVANQDGSFRMFNRAAQRILGMGAVEGGPSRWGARYGIFCADGITPAEERHLPLARALNGEVVEDVELFVRNQAVPEGAWILVSAQPLGGPGRPDGAVAVFRDITESKRAAEAQARLAAIVESTESAILGVTLDGVITSWNRGARAALGYEAEEVVGRSVGMLIPPDRHGELAEMRRALLAGESIDGLESVRVRKDGTPIDVSLTVSPLRDTQGEVIGASVVGRDITRQRRAERYHGVQNAVTNVLAEARADADVVPGVLAAIGSGMGWEIAEFWELDQAARVLRSGSVWHASGIGAAEFDARSRELTFERGVGVPGKAWTTGRPVLVSNILDDEHFLSTSVAARHGLRAAVGLPIRSGNSTLGVMVFFSGELKALDDDLVEMMRTASAQVGHFLERRRAEREAERLKDEFFGLVSHELRTPLTSIVGYLELLLESETGEEERRRFLEVVRRNATRLLRLVGDLLFVTRVQAGQFALVPAQVELNEVIEESVEASRPAADARGIEIAVEVAALPPLTGDRDRLAQLLDNLVSNAVKYASEGGAIRVSVAAGERSAVLTVHNTGSYIPPDEQERLFERFFRASAATRRLTPGIGLGLTIAKAITDAHGGRISVTSDEHEGTTFRVELPLDEARRALALTAEGGDRDGQRA